MATAESIEAGDIPAFTRGPQGSIAAWNEAIEDLLGISAQQAVGKPCHEIIAGLDVFGNTFCCSSCAVSRMSRVGLSINPFQLQLRNVQGERIKLDVAIFRQHTTSTSPSLVHLASPVAVTAEQGPTFRKRWWDSDCEKFGLPDLTPKELEVLRLVADGWRTEEVARTMSISICTVRNHISKCLQKFGVHSRVEAIAAARRFNLME